MRLTFKGVQKAIDFEIQRQIEAVEKGERIIQETRLWDSKKELTVSMRSKEAANDYRYFPEPDLVPVAPSLEMIEKIRAALPEKPSVRRKKLQEAWQVPDKEMAAMVNADVLDLVEETVKLGCDPTRARGWWLGEIARIANEKGVAAGELSITATDVAEIVSLIEKGELTDKLARQVVDGVINGEGKPSEIIKNRGIQVGS